MTPKTFEPGEFLKALSEGSLSEPIVKEGMAKPDPSDPQAFLFSEGGVCGPWLKMPTDLVEKVEFLGMHSCKELLANKLSNWHESCLVLGYGQGIPR
jgi:hypothetical protein